MPQEGKKREEDSRFSSPRPTEDSLMTKEIVVERKTFMLELRQNHHGRFLRIREQTTSNRNNSIIIPMAGVADLKNGLCEMLAFSDQRPL